MRHVLIWVVVCLGLSATATWGQQSAFEQSGLVGKLENPAIITDPARLPKVTGQAPQLAALVAAGKLPPVAERVGTEPMVLEPLHSVGRYGGTWRRGFLGRGDGENGNRIRSGDKLLFWDKTGTQIAPGVAKGYEISADGKRTTLFLRRGMKWSDGSPFTADDFMFWNADMYQNKEICPSPAPELSVNGKPARIVKVDETTVAFEFDEPNFLFPLQLAGDTQVGGGHSRLQAGGLALGLYAPSRYLKQFLPKYSSVETMNAQAKAAGFENWLQYFKYKIDWQLNPDLPTLSAWVMTSPINTQAWTMERNPFYFVVDTSGNQLPYIDKVVLTLAENPEIINLRAIAGDYDFMERFIDITKLPVFVENAARGGYKVRLDQGVNGSDSLLFFNLAYQQDPEIRKWFQNVDFRRALSIAIDRSQLNEAFWLGLGTPGTTIPAAIIPESPGESFRNTWASQDAKKANAMLDAIGLTKKDREGYRLRTDNGQRLRIQIDVAQTLTPTWPQQVEMIIQQWRAVGIAADMKLLERSLFFTRIRNDDHQMTIWSNNGTEALFLFTVFVLPIDPNSSHGGVGHAKWFVSNGAAGLKPEIPELLHAYERYRQAPLVPEPERIKIAQEIWRAAVEGVWSIGLVGQSPTYMGTRVVNVKLENVPERVCISQHCRTPWSGRPDQWYFRQ